MDPNGYGLECAVLVDGLTAAIAAEMETTMKKGTTFQVPPGRRQLFLDDSGIAKVDKLTRTMHPPAKKGAVVRPDLKMNIGAPQIRMAPIWDLSRKVFKLWTCASTPNDLHAKGICTSSYFESPDGLHWSAPVMNQVEYRGSKDNNLVFAIDSAVYDPLDSDPNCRFKGFKHGGRELIAMGGDGKTWKKLDAPPIPSWDEFNLSYDEVGKQFIATVKDAGHAGGYGGTGRYGRSAWLSTSRDFRQWTRPELIFETDDEDQKIAREAIQNRFDSPAAQHPQFNDPADYNADVYNMGVFRYEGLYIGLPAIYYATGKLPEGNTDGFHHIQLACSRDLHKWERLGARKPFIGPSPPGAGAYDLTQIIGPSSPIVRDDALWLYYTGIKYRAAPEGADADRGAVCLAVLRRDGFMSLDAGAEEGVLITKPFTAAGGNLFVNVEAPNGELRVEVLDPEGRVAASSAALTGDLPRGRVPWRRGTLADLVSKQVSLRFLLRNAAFYSYWAEK